LDGRTLCERAFQERFFKSDMPAQLKRFIAGARCPTCNALDKIYVTEEDGEALLICNSCGYREYQKAIQKKKNGGWQPIKLPGSSEPSG
jgi:uncharacterized metal-binding protein (TIGR02443 family)